ncbi:MAG: hypothetical protein NZ772_13030 [Cyanobacteria bacterium]|nr:hypothetical protein [Cyanobacteriota bacterium]MDW8202301.1 hypothetical protein [Cyanobacteriota bacterium SKYGB_h_bin112]
MAQHRRTNWWFVWTVAVMMVVITHFASSRNVIAQSGVAQPSPVNVQPLLIQNVWREVYRQLPDLPLENQYVSRDTGQVATDNTLVRRMIQYHVFQKGRPPGLRLDWKLTLADYLGVNEYMDPDDYVAGARLTPSPLIGDQAAIKRLSRVQREELVQTLVALLKIAR